VQRAPGLPCVPFGIACVPFGIALRSFFGRAGRCWQNSREMRGEIAKLYPLFELYLLFEM
jgi:hypothetical protein